MHITSAHDCACFYTEARASQFYELGKGEHMDCVVMIQALQDRISGAEVWVEARERNRKRDPVFVRTAAQQVLGGAPAPCSRRL